MARRNASSGFTLVELMVVTIIIEILAAIAVPQFFLMVERAKAREAVAWIEDYKMNEEVFMTQNSRYWGYVHDSTLGMNDVCGFKPDGSSAQFPFMNPMPAFQRFNLGASPTSTTGCTYLNSYGNGIPAWGIPAGTQGYWLILTHKPPCPALYGCYSIFYDKYLGYDCTGDANFNYSDCSSDLLPGVPLTPEK